MSTTALSTTATPAPAAVLTPNDCGSQAYVCARLRSGSELLFCGHHARQYGSELRKIAVTISDQTGLLDQ